MEQLQSEEQKPELLKRKLDQAFLGERGMEIFNSVPVFVKSLRDKYGKEEVCKYRLYHLLANSSIGSPCPHFDFPTEDSAEKFIETL